MVRKGTMAFFILSCHNSNFQKILKNQMTKQKNYAIFELVKLTN